MLKMVDKDDRSRWRRDPFDPDLLDIRSVTLGGDEPGLQVEIDHINRTKKSVSSQEKEGSKNSSEKG